MTGETIAVGGRVVRLRRDDDGRIDLAEAGRGRLGTLWRTPDGRAFLAAGVDGALLDAPSAWGGRIPLRFATIELAARALLAEGEP